jgi:hypothetical protein
VDIGKSFGYIFNDPRWLTKVLIGILVLLISFLLAPILVGFLGFFIVSGYALEVLQNVRRDDALPLPEWRDRWGEWLVLGLKLAVVEFVWALPAIILNVPTAFANSMVRQGGDAASIGGIMAFCFGCLAFLWYIVVALATPAIYVKMAETEEIVSGFRFGEILEFTRDNIGDVIVATLLIVVVGFIAFLVGGIVGALLCIIGLAITLPAATLYTTLFQVHLYGQIGRKPTAQPSQLPAVVPPPVPPAPPATPVSVPAVPAEPMPEPEFADDGQPEADAGEDEQ